MPEKVRVACDPIGLAIPLCIDYLIAREICDESSLAAFLQLDDSIVKKALEKLRDHGILKDEEIYKEQFNMHKNRIADATAQQFRAHRKEGSMNAPQAAPIRSWKRS